MRQFNVTTSRSKTGIVYTYTNEGLFAGIQINETMQAETLQYVVNSIRMTLDQFFEWAKAINGIEVVELQQGISFDMFWNVYNDKARSSKKKSLQVWNRLGEPDKVKAYYYIPKYNKHRGNAEKKYCETYLNAELWNN